MDGTAWVSGLWPLLRAIARNAYRSRAGRRPVHGAAVLLFGVLADRPGSPVLYLSGGPPVLGRPVVGFLRRNGFPAGSVRMMGRSGSSKRNADRKRAALERVADAHPGVCWILVGDRHSDFAVSFARRHPNRVAAVVLRDASGTGGAEWIGRSPVLRGAHAAGLLPRLRAALEFDGAHVADHEWFLTTAERGNDASRLRAWTEGNGGRALVHGRSYFSALAEAIANAGEADTVLFSGWRGDADERLTDDGQTVGRALAAAIRRGAVVRGLLWRSHLELIGFSSAPNRDLSVDVAAAGGEALLDHRVRPTGSHHQKFVVVRSRRPAGDVAFVGGIDLGHGRRDDARHAGDPQPARMTAAYGSAPAWHDVQVELRGPAVSDVEDVFRERWEDPAALSRLPWHAIPDLMRRLTRIASRPRPPRPDPPAAGSCGVQVLRTYPRRRPALPYAPDGERSIARAYGKALGRARRLIYIEDQYLWSAAIAEVLAEALRRQPLLQLIVVRPRYPDRDDVAVRAAMRLGHVRAAQRLREAGGERVQILDLEAPTGLPIYVHAKVCVIDDVWALVGSANLNRRSWTHDSELSVAVVDAALDDRMPKDPGGLGDRARRFARGMRLELMREHLERADGDDGDLIDPDGAATAIRRSAARLDAWHRGGQDGPRPPGRLRRHDVAPPSRWQLPLAAAAYGLLVDPDGRSAHMRRRRAF